MTRSHSKHNTIAQFTAVAASSFAGMMLAVPLAFALGNPASTVEARSDQSSVVGSQADFAKYAFAFNQGYEAKATSMVSNGGVCTEASVSTPGSGSAHATSAVSENGPSNGPAALMTSTPMNGGNGSWKQAPAHTPKHQSDDSKRWEAMMNSYNTYTSTVNNTTNVTNTTTTNTNSNNTIGSHNSTSTTVNVEDSLGVMVGVSSDSTSTQNAASESFNNDSYNTSTETNTATINDSFNTETNTAINSGNTTTTVSNETAVNDSYNTETHTMNNTSTNTTTNTTNTTVNDSYNNNNVLEIPYLPLVVSGSEV